MESASIWDIYSNAKKLIPLYDRMQNRALRQSSSSAQRKTQLGDTTNVSESPMNEVKNDWIGISMLNDDISQMEDITTNLSYFNNNHDTNMISVDLLTPLSSSPGNNSNTNTTLAGLAPSGLTTCISNGSSNVNTSSTAIATTTTTKANVTATNLGASKNPAVNESSSTDNGNKSLFQNQRSSKNTGKPVTPNSLTESPNDNAITNSKGNLNAQANINTNSNNKFAFSDIIDFNHDDFLNEHENYESFDFINNFQQLEKDFLNKGSNENINGESSSNFHITQNHIDNEKQSNEIQTIRPVDIKVKSNSSVSVNNENIVSGKSNLPESENNHSSISNAKPTRFISTSIPNLSSAKPKTKIIKFNNEKLDCASPSSPSSRVHISSTPQPNELQTQARQSNKISFSAPNKENSKLTKCNNCGTSKTPLWRKDPSGNTLCNACGLFLKLHGTMRPLSLKTDVIKKRNSKRQSLSNQGEGYKNLAHLSQSQNQKLYTNTGVMNTGIYFPQSLPNHSNFSTINDSIPLQFHQKSQLHSQPQQNIIQQNILPRSKSQKSRTSLNHVQLQSQLQSQFQVQSVSQSPTSSGSTPASVSNGNKKVKNVPILPKPLKDGSLPGTPTSAAQISSSFSCPSTQPQDIPQFKRRKSKLSLASLSSFQNSQPSSPMTVIPSNVPSYSPSPSPSSSSVMYSPGNHTFNNNTANSNIESPSFFGNNSRQNSISSSHSFSSHLYNDLNSKRGLSFSNSNQNNGAANNSSFGGLSLSFQNQRQNQQPPSNFSNLSAGINAIKTHNDDNISSNYSGSNFKSGLGKCVVTHNDGGTEANMEDLDWLKFDI